MTYMKNRYLLPLLLLSAGACSAEYPAPINALQEQGAVIEEEFTTEAGTRGYIARLGERQVALYLSEDENHVFAGNMVDTRGINLTARHLETYAPEPSYNSAWPQLEEADWIVEGDPAAPHVVYVFTDPNCPFCHQFWEDARPFVGEQAQLRHIMVGVLKADSEGKAAAILAADDPRKALQKHESGFDQGGTDALADIPPQIRQQLAANASLMQALGATGTPAIFYRDDSDQVRRILGLPRSEKQLREVFAQ